MQGYLFNTSPAVNTCTRSLGLTAHMNLGLDNGRQHGVYVSMLTLSMPNCVVRMCMYAAP